MNGIYQHHFEHELIQCLYHEMFFQYTQDPILQLRYQNGYFGVRIYSVYSFCGMGNLHNMLRDNDHVRGVPSIEQLMEEITLNRQKRAAMKKDAKKAPQPRAKPRILRTNISRASTPAKTEDEVSVNSNKYNKRFTKTQKPARL